MENFLDTLNNSQREAVVYCDGPQLVIAGAGSGKTRVLTMKIAYLLQNGYNPGEIIALTFTKKAATEMKNRIGSLVGTHLSRRLWMGTFHSLFSRILRQEAERLGFKSDFTIYDQTDSRSLIKTIIKEKELDDKIYKPNGVQTQISNAKNNLITPEMYLSNRELIMYDARAKRPLIGEIYRTYWNRCYQAGAMDFDDLLLYTNILFRDHPEVLEFYQTYFQYVLVDEYQDTNKAQNLIVEQLVRRHNHLTVVGDDAQSIYSFRGANIRNILDLRNHIPETKLFKLEQNYRSTRNIVNAANSLISKNKEQIHKTIFSEREEGSLLTLTGTYSDIEEAYSVSEKIYRLHEIDNFSYKDCAILYRTNAQSRILEESLRKKGIEYRIYGGLSFYQRKEIKDIIAYLRLIINPNDEEAFKRVINYPARGIGDTTLGKLTAAIDGKSHFELCKDPIGYNIPVNKPTAAKLQGFVALIEDFQQYNLNHNAFELTNYVIQRSEIKKELSLDATVEGQSRRENVEELMNAIQSFITTCEEEGDPNNKLIDFLADVSLSGDVEPANDTANDADLDFVAMMTIHQAKGLEFKNIFIVGIEEGLLPSEMAMNEPGGLEEERRLLYVAITRAKENCFLSYSKQRFRNGRSEQTTYSRFLKDIDRRYIKQTTNGSNINNYGASGGGHFGNLGNLGNFSSLGKNVGFKPFEQGPVPEKKKPVSNISFGDKQIVAGTRIEHDRFGQGTVLELSGELDNARIVVKFDNVGTKTLLLKFAKISVL